MSRRLEKEPKIQIRMFDSGDDYDKYLRERGLEPYEGARAKGIKYRNGVLEVAIHSGYYLGGGIQPDQLQAIVVHEVVELQTDHPKSDLLATVAEYKFILDQDGPDGLRQYHANLGNLMGGINTDTRKTALNMLLK